MTPPVVLWIDSAANKLAAGWNSFVWSLPPLFKQGDTITVILRWIKRPTVYDSFMEEVPWGAGDITIDIGSRALPPLGGQWYINFEDSTSELLGYDAVVSDLENALNSMPDIVSAGGVSVTQLHEDGFKIVFESNGVRTAMTGIGNSLVPTSRVLIDQVATGGVDTKAVFWVYLRQATVSEVTSAWVTEDPCTAGVTELSSNIWDIYLSSQPQDGTFTVTFDGVVNNEVSVFSTASMMQAAFGASYTVTKQGDYRWRVRTVSGASFEPVIVSSNIISFNGKTATLKIDDQKASELLSGVTKLETNFEVSINDGADHITILSAPCTLVGKLTQ